MLAALVMATMAYLGRDPLLQAAGDFLVVSDALRPADAVIAIGGDGPARIRTAMELLRDRYGRWLVISGGPYGRGKNSAFMMRDQAIAEGMDGERILVDDLAESTLDNAVGSAKLLRVRGLHTAILLTSPYHTRRAIAIFSRVFHPEGLLVRVLAVDDGHFRVDHWWTRDFERHLVLREYVKLLAFLGGL